MFRRIRIRAGSANVCPYNTPSIFLKNTSKAFSVQLLATTVPFMTASYADWPNLAILEKVRIWSI